MCGSVTCNHHGSLAESWIAFLVVARVEIRNKDSTPNLRLWLPSAWGLLLLLSSLFFSESLSLLLVARLLQNYHTLELKENLESFQEIQ